MRTLEQALSEHDLVVLRVIGDWHNLDLTGKDKLRAVSELAEQISGLDLQSEMEYLEPEEADALADLVRQGGRASVGIFSRDHGEVRLMGPGRMEREEPWLDPISPAESLWYHGLIFRGFDNTSEGALEFYYIPRELLDQLSSEARPAVIEPESPIKSDLQPLEQPGTVLPPPIDAVDDLTTLLALAARQSGGLPSEHLTDFNHLLVNPDRDRLSLLLTLATEMSLLRQTDGSLRPSRAAIEWLQSGRETQLRSLIDAWSRSIWNDLRHIPDLIIESGNWSNDPLLARTALMDVLPVDDRWYRIADVVAILRRQNPDFQRPDGNYEDWYIRDAITHQYLAGFENWDQVEGRLLRFLIQGPLHWLGMTELSAIGDERDACYRLTDRALLWLGDQPAAADTVTAPLIIQPDSSLLVPYNASRYDRFQAARIADPEPLTPGKPYRYQITPSSLAAAGEQGISAERILKFLESAGGRPLPTSIRRGIARWSEKGIEGRLQSVVVLRVGDATILETLRANPKTRDFIGEALGELAVVIRQDEWQTFQQAVAQLGLLLDVEP